MTKMHTPGPWGIDKATHVWIMAGDLHVATIPRAHDGDWSEANAALIAAAPDLLEALRDAERALADPAAFGDMVSAEALVSVRAAIAKAEGQQ